MDAQNEMGQMASGLPNCDSGAKDALPRKGEKRRRKAVPPGCRLSLPQMAAGDSQVRKDSYSFRGALEAAVVERCGSIGVAQASRIATAATAMRRAAQVDRRLATEGATLSIADWVALADRSVRYRETIDRCLLALGLDAIARPVDREPDGMALAAHVEAQGRRYLPSPPEGQPEPATATHDLEDK